MALLIGLLPVVAAAQQVPPDKDCGDFQSRIQAQGWYLFVQQLSGERDPHRLDADGNGIACESITTIQRDSVSGTSHAWSEVKPRVSTVNCVDTSFTLADFTQATRDGFRGEGDHRKWTTMMQCVELHLSILQNQ